MARLTNTPIQTLTLDLERRKSFSFRCVVLNNERNPLDLSGCVARFVMKDAEYDGDLYDMTNLIVNSEGEIASPESGEISFSFQAAELDGPPGEYNYSIVMWTQDGFSIVLLKGVLNLHPNTESLSVTRTYTTSTANAALEVVLRGNDVIEVISNTMPQGVGGSNIVGTGRPDNPSTLEAKSLALVASAPVGAVFVSLDGAGAGLWAWRKRTAGWFVIEGGAVAWTRLSGVPPTFSPKHHNHPVTDIAATGIRSSSTFLSGSGAWTTPSAEWSNISGKPATFAPAAHTHLAEHLTDTTTTGRALMRALNPGAARAAIGAGSSDLVLGTTAGTAAEGNHTHSQYSMTSHLHLVSDVSGLQTKLNKKADISHSHDLATINGLSAALASKSAVGHSHDFSNINGLSAALAAKAAVDHTHSLSSLAGVEAAIPYLTTVELNDPQTPYAMGRHSMNWRALTGFAELPSTDVVGHVFYGGTPRGYYWGTWVQTVVVALEDGTSRTITRVSTDGTSYGAWTLQPLAGGGGGGVTNPYLIVGPGRPDTPATTGGIITGSEPVGCEYRSTDGANVGAWVWMKRPTGWTVTDGDTGWRNITDLVDGVEASSNRGVFIRRKNAGFEVAISVLKVNVAGTKHITLPADWKLATNFSQTSGAAIVTDDGTPIGKITFWAGNLELKFSKTGGNIGGTLYTTATQPGFPITLIGTPA